MVRRPLWSALLGALIALLCSCVTGGQSEPVGTDTLDPDGMHSAETDAADAEGQDWSFVCRAANQCQDDDPCTLDLCTDGACEHSTLNEGLCAAECAPRMGAAVASVPIAGRSGGLALRGNHAYVAYDGGILILDITGDTPTTAGVFTNVPTAPSDVTVQGAFALAMGPAGLSVLDVSVPTLITPAAWLPLDFEPEMVQAAQGRAYLTSRVHGLTIVDLSDPTAPAVLGHLGPEEPEGGVTAVQIRGDLAYAASWRAGFQVIDVTDPTSPMTLATVPTSGLAAGVHVVGDHAFVVDADGTEDAAAGLRVYDIGQPLNPTLVGETHDFGNDQGPVLTAGVGQGIFVAEHLQGLRLRDVTDPANPTTVGVFPADVHGVALDAIAQRAYITGALAGDTGGDTLWVLPITCAD